MHARRALQEGALGFLSKRSAPETLLDAVFTIAPGAATSSRPWRKSLRTRNSTAITNRPSISCRSGNSKSSYVWRAAPRCSELRTDLKLSASTIGTHLYNIKQKLGVVNQSELTLIAIRHGLIEA